MLNFLTEDLSREEIFGSLHIDDDGNEYGKKTLGLDWQDNSSTRASRFFVHFFAVAARLQSKVPNFPFRRGRERR